MNLKRAPPLSISSVTPACARDVSATRSTLTSAPSVSPSGKLGLTTSQVSTDQQLYCRYCSQRCLTNDWKYHSHRCRRPLEDDDTLLGSRRLKGSKKQEHRRDCDVIMAKMDPVSASVLFDGFLRNYCEYEDKARCRQYNLDKIRLDRVHQTLRLCSRCEDPNCECQCELSCVVM